MCQKRWTVMLSRNAQGVTRLQSWNPTPQKPSTSTGWSYSPFLSPFQETSAAHCCEFFTGQGTFFFPPKLHSKNFYILALGPHLAVLRSHSFLGGPRVLLWQMP